MICIVRKRKRIYAVCVKRLAGILAGFLIFAKITNILNQMYVSYSLTNAWYSNLWQQFYLHEGAIENLFLGSSHVYCGIDPEIMDQLTGECNFNLASPNQPLNGSYYLLREADKKNKLSHVYLEVGHCSFYRDTRLSEYMRNWSNTDHMKWSFNKVAYMLEIGGCDQYANILFPYTRYREYLGRWDYITKVLSRKKEEDYTYHLETDWGEDGIKTRICEKGYSYSTKVFKDEDKYFKQTAVLKDASMGERSMEYCRRVIEYCRKREIPITLYIAPIHDLELISTLDYDAYIIELRDLAAEYDLEIYDFNLAKEEYLSLQANEYFRNTGHLSPVGAEVFTPFFYQVVSGEEADNRKYFYDTYQEKLDALAPTVYGAYYIDSYDDAGEQTRNVFVASNRDSGMEYRILLTPDESEPYIIQDFETNKEFTVSAEEHGICTIVTRMKASPDEEVQTVEICY